MSVGKIFQRERDRVFPDRGLVLVDFWAPWCDVCQGTSLLADELAEKYRGKLVKIKVNVDDQPVLAARFHVHDVPTLALVREGELIEQFVGFTAMEKIQEAIERVLERQ